jgi:plasmid stabilization system protein ParE
MAAGAPAKRLEWAARALDAYLATLARIADEDPDAARRFADRVEQSLATIQSYPLVGTPASRRGERRYPIPDTGHVINYRVSRGAIRIRIWHRARQHVLRRA